MLIKFGSEHHVTYLHNLHLSQEVAGRIEDWEH